MKTKFEGQLANIGVWATYLQIEGKKGDTGKDNIELMQKHSTTTC